MPIQNSGLDIISKIYFGLFWKGELAGRSLTSRALDIPESYKRQSLPGACLCMTLAWLGGGTNWEMRCATNNLTFKCFGFFRTRTS